MAGFDYDIGIIGGGAAGLTVAAGAAQLGAKTLLVEKEPALGGDCLHYGCVPSKTLIHTARVHHQTRHLSRYGLADVDAPPVDFARVAARIREVIGTIQKHDSPERFRSLGAHVEFGAPEFVNDRKVRLNGKAISARAWVVATGSSPAIPPIEGLAQTSYLTNKDIFSLDRLPGSMLILGAGPIAIEMAQAFTRLGCKVGVVQRSNRILSREDEDMAALVQRALEAEGVVFHLGCEVRRVREAGGQREVVAAFADGREATLRADALLVAMGREPNVHGLGLDNAGIASGQAGIHVDARMRTNQKHIYAAGDVTGRYLFTHAAGYEGGIVVANAIVRWPRKADYSHFPWCTYCSPELASIGHNETSARKAGLAYDVWTEEFAANDRAVCEGETTGRIKLLLGARGKRLGVQILGARAGDLLGEWVGVLAGNVGMSRLAGAMHPYPTLAEINKRVAGGFISAKLFSDFTRKTLALFFNYRGQTRGPSRKAR